MGGPIVKVYCPLCGTELDRYSTEGDGVKCPGCCARIYIEWAGDDILEIKAVSL